MKKLTKKQMKKLKGKLNEMDYNLTDSINYSSMPPPTSTGTQSSVCRIAAMTSDND
jgi:hypothetical protein